MNETGSILFHPVRMRIVRTLAGLGSATAAALSEKMPDIPRTTLYRHIRLLYEEGYLDVVREEQKRGTLEREYAVTDGRSAGNRQRQDTAAFLLRLLGDFERYYGDNGADPEGDMLFASFNRLNLTDEEFEGFLREIFQVVEKYLSLPGGEKKHPRNISLISSPPSGE